MSESDTKEIKRIMRRAKRSEFLRALRAFAFFLSVLAMWLGYYAVMVANYADILNAATKGATVAVGGFVWFC